MMHIYQDSVEPKPLGIWLVTVDSPVIRALVHHKIADKSYWLDGDSVHHDWLYVVDTYANCDLSYIL